MTQNIRISQHPVFPENTFRNHPDLFWRFQQNSPEHLQARYDRQWHSISHYEETIRWQLVEGPGFQAAAHPGADTVFVDIMVGINSYVYNSDCLYINPARRIFAVSDPPGITTCSRRLMERLDRAVQDQMEDIEQTVNRLSEQTRPEDGATLSLVAFPDGTPGQAVVVIAGDTFVFRGNINARTFQQLSGTHDFIGTPYVTYKAQEIPYEPGDFFIIASDGIVSLVGKDPERNLERAFLTLMKDGRDGLVYRAVCAANGYYHEKIYDRLFSRFGGNDNISMLAIFPEQLEKDSTAESIILGGYLEERL